MTRFRNDALRSVSAAALLIGFAAPAAAQVLERNPGEVTSAGRYQSGDLHNHTVCTDGSTSTDKIVTDSLTYLDWYIMSDHSGSGSRDCRFNDTAQTWDDETETGGLPSGRGDDERVFWDETICAGEDGEDLCTEDSDPTTAPILGFNSDGTTPRAESGRMWRWQSLGQYQYADTVTDPEGPIADNPAENAPGTPREKPAALGVEWVVPGHEHGSAAIVEGQLPADPTLVAGLDPGLFTSNGLGIAQFEYCFAENSEDTGGGFNRDWTCEISPENNAKLIAMFAGRENLNEGPADYNGTLPNYDPDTGTCTFEAPGDCIIAGDTFEDQYNHVKSVAAIYWLRENFPTTSYAIGAHVERDGAFIGDPPDGDPVDGNGGFNIEHFRDWHTAGYDEVNGAYNISWGFESQPGHQGQYNRGSYGPRRPTSGGYTYGGTGCYAAAEAAKPGMDFDGTPLTENDLVGTPFEGQSVDLSQIVLCRPGVRTMWDAMLSEGREFYFSGSSDWHNRGAFAYDDYRTTNDFIPGEYQRNYTYIRARNAENPAVDIVQSLQSGNSYVVNGDLIEDLAFRACWNRTCATMGETLTVPAGATVEIFMRVNDPGGPNLSQYEFPNPALQQLGIEEPLNAPSLRVVQFIKGDIRPEGFYTPAEPGYYDPLAPETTAIAATYTQDGEEGPEPQAWRGRGAWKRMTYTVENVTSDMYVRARGTNLPLATPNATDADGNPLRDDLRNNIRCLDAACPAHVFVGEDPENPEVDVPIFTADVRTWGDLWFYANPIFIRVEG